MLPRTLRRPPPAVPAAGRRAPPAASSPARPQRRRAAAVAAIAATAAAAPSRNGRRRCRRLPPLPGSTLSSADGVCYTGNVTWDNDASDDCTVLAIESPEYDGLLRVIAWVLFGLQLRVRAAVLRSSADADAAEGEEGGGSLLGEAGGAASRADSALGRALAGGNGSGGAGGSGADGGYGGGAFTTGGVATGVVTDVLWVTDRRGRKLSDKSADGVAERLQEFISTCAPDEDAAERFEAGLQGWECPGGGLHATNGSDPRYTQLTVTADDYSPGLVLEMTSVIAGMGVAVREAVVRSGGMRLGGQSSNGNANSGGGVALGVGGNGASAGAAARSAALPSLPLGMVPSMAAEITRALESLPEPPPGKRVLRFWLYDKGKKAGGAGGGKLSFEQVQALLYCIGLATGKGNLTTSPPNKTITGCACSPVPPVFAASASASAPSSRGESTNAFTTGDESS